MIKHGRYIIPLSLSPLSLSLHHHTYLIQNPLCTPDLALPGLDHRRRMSDRHSQRLKRALGAVMVVVAVQAVHVQRHGSVLRKGLEAVGYHF